MSLVIALGNMPAEGATARPAKDITEQAKAVTAAAHYLQQREPVQEQKPVEKPTPARDRNRVKLSYKETRELEALPGEIEALEAEQQALMARMSEPEYFRQAPDVLRADRARSAEIEALLMEKLERWHALEEKVKP